MSKARRILLSKCALGDVEEQLRRSPKVIVPVGATEQHRPHETQFSGCGGFSILSISVKKVNLPNGTQLWATIDMFPVGIITISHDSAAA